MPTKRGDHEEQHRFALRDEIGEAIQQWLTHLLSCSETQAEWFGEERWVKKIPYDLDTFLYALNKPLSPGELRGIEALASSLQTAHMADPKRRPSPKMLQQAVKSYGDAMGFHR
jgi:hypothetical protein